MNTRITLSPSILCLSAMLMLAGCTAPKKAYQPLTENKTPTSVKDASLSQLQPPHATADKQPVLKEKAETANGVAAVPRHALEECKKSAIGYAAPQAAPMAVCARALAPAAPANASLFQAVRQVRDFNTEGYDHIDENGFKNVLADPLSTFSIDVDKASYANVRRFLTSGTLPPPDAVRIEEMINYFSYAYPQPTGDAPFSITTELGTCPWNSKHQMALVGLKGRIIKTENLPPSNLVFLIDVSGSMESPEKLPLIQQALQLLVEQMRSQDHIALSVYAGAAGLVLPSTPGNRKQRIIDAINALSAGGSTAGSEGIELAYATAKQNFIPHGNNRVILATDGDFNVGPSSDAELVRLIERKREDGIFLTVLGFGAGNYQDGKMMKLADKGNGNYAYIDNIKEARKVLVSEMGGTLLTIAKDVKIQVEFNPATVASYRLIGYEKRKLNNEDFNDDSKDAGELGSGHCVTALYEIVPAGTTEKTPGVDGLKNQVRSLAAKETNELLTVKFRYKEPLGNASKLIVQSLSNQPVNAPSENFRFAASVVGFGMLLRDSKFKGALNFAAVRDLALSSRGADADGLRAEFIELLQKAEKLKQTTM